MTLSEGDKAPPLTLPRDGGGRVSLADFQGRKLVLFFYPKADTEGCTREALDFSARARTFARAGTDLLGVSADPVRKLDRFKAKHGITVALASDEALTTLKAYGVWAQKSMYGRTFMGIVRTTVLIDPKGRVAKLWTNVKVPGHADEVLEAARAL